MESTLEGPGRLRAVICSLGAQSLEIVARELQTKGYDVVLALPLDVAPSDDAVADWCLNLDRRRPEAMGLIARFSSVDTLLIDGWGIPPEAGTSRLRIDVDFVETQAGSPEVDAGSLLIALAGQSEQIALSDDGLNISAGALAGTVRTASNLERLGVDSSQVRALSAERII